MTWSLRARIPERQRAHLYVRKKADTFKNSDGRARILGVTSSEILNGTPWG